jgi:hypothetical protein
MVEIQETKECDFGINSKGITRDKFKSAIEKNQKLIK